MKKHENVNFFAQKSDFSAFFSYSRGLPLISFKSLQILTQSKPIFQPKPKAEKQKKSLKFWI